MARVLKVKKCWDCPLREPKDSNGPCGSDSWIECSITGTMIDGHDAPSESKEWHWRKHDFPPSCPLKECECE